MAKISRTKNQLTIRLSIQKPTPSHSGKTLIIASTRGSVTSNAKYKGKPIVIVANAFVYPDDLDLRKRARESLERMRSQQD